MKKLQIVIIAALLLALLCACAPNPTEEQGVGKEIVITDVLGREVIVKGDVKRIVSLSPALTEMIYALGAGSKLVGVDFYSDFPAEAQSIEKVGDFITPDTERILALEPDLVIAGNKLQRDAVDALEALGLNVAALEATDIDGIYNSARLIGTLLGDEVAAEALCDEMDDRLNSILSGITNEDRPTVYYVMSYGEGGDWTSGQGSFINELIELAGGVCVTSDMPVPWVNFSLEELVSRDPQVLLVADYLPIEELMVASGYKELSAVNNGRVYPVNTDLISRPGPRIFDALEEVRDAIHR